MDIYLDFDNTLFDTDRLFNDIISLFENNGVDKKYILDARKTVIPFSLDKLLDYLKKYVYIDFNLNNELNNIMKKANKYVFSDVYDFIDYLNKKNYRIHILTCGSYSWQNLKIISSGLNNIIHDIIITNNKGNISNIDYNSSIFIDDNPKHLDVFLNKNAKKVIRLKRKNLYYSKQIFNHNKIITCNNLKDVKTYL